MYKVRMRKTEEVEFDIDTDSRNKAMYEAFRRMDDSTEKAWDYVETKVVSARRITKNK